MIILNLY